MDEMAREPGEGQSLIAAFFGCNGSLILPGPALNQMGMVKGVTAPFYLRQGWSFNTKT